MMFNILLHITADILDSIVSSLPLFADSLLKSQPDLAIS
jgi:hypothetical protein